MSAQMKDVMAVKDVAVHRWDGSIVPRKWCGTRSTLVVAASLIHLARERLRNLTVNISDIFLLIWLILVEKDMSNV